MTAIRTRVATSTLTLAIATLAALAGCQSEDSTEAPSVDDDDLDTLATVYSYAVAPDGATWQVATLDPVFYTYSNGTRDAAARAKFTWWSGSAASAKDGKFGVCLIKYVGGSCGTQNPTTKLWSACPLPTGGYNYCVSNQCWVRPGNRANYCAGTPVDQHNQALQGINNPATLPKYASGTSFITPVQFVGSSAVKSIACFGANHCAAGQTSSPPPPPPDCNQVCYPQTGWLNGSTCVCGAIP